MKNGLDFLSLRCAGMDGLDSLVLMLTASSVHLPFLTFSWQTIDSPRDYRTGEQFPFKFEFNCFFAQFARASDSRSDSSRKAQWKLLFRGSLTVH
jgi:hypothetical protein